MREGLNSLSESVWWNRIYERIEEWIPYQCKLIAVFYTECMEPAEEWWHFYPVQSKPADYPDEGHTAGESH